MSQKALSSELSGNIIDLCPVGALTSKPYAYTARPWELRKTDSIDVLDAVGANIRIDARGAEVLRILPRMNDDVNEEWLGDKSRFSVDGLKRRRLDRPWLRENGKLRAVSWEEAFAAIAAKVKGTAPERIGAIAGDLCDVESMLALKEFFTALGSKNLDCRQDGAVFDASKRPFYLFNTSIAGIEEADALLIIGSNPRHEAPVLNARIRKRWLTGGLKVALIGQTHDLTYGFDHLGTGPEAISSLLDGTHRLRRSAEDGEKADGDFGRRARWRGRMARRSMPPPGSSRRSSTCSPRTGTVSTCCTMRRRASARWISASCPARAARARRRCWAAAWTYSGCWAPMSSTPRRSAPTPS